MKIGFGKHDNPLTGKQTGNTARNWETRTGLVCWYASSAAPEFRVPHSQWMSVINNVNWLILIAIGLFISLSEWHNFQGLCLSSPKLAHVKCISTCRACVRDLHLSIDYDDDKWNAALQQSVHLTLLRFNGQRPVSAVFLFFCFSSNKTPW